MTPAFDEYFMQMALREAARAAADGEVPAGCVIVDVTGLAPDAPPACARILARAHNQAEQLKDATAHAEMLALTAAANVRGAWRLTGTRLYVTKEPCPMCAGAIVLARPDAVIWGAADPKRGGGTVFGIFDHPGINHHPQIVPGVLEAPCVAQLKAFFRARRAAAQSETKSQDEISGLIGGRPEC